MATRVNAVFEQRLPVSIAIAYDAGAMVNGAQNSVNTVTVHAGHSLLDGDLFLYALSDTNIQTYRVFTVTTAGATTILFAGDTFSFPDSALLIPLGTDTGGTQREDGSYTLPNWDGSTVSMYSDSAGDDAITSVTVNPRGEAGFYSDTVPTWVIGLDSGNRPVQMLIDVGALTTDTGGVTRAASFPSAPSLGDQHLLISGSVDILYTYMTTSSGPDWVEGISAP